MRREPETYLAEAGWDRLHGNWINIWMSVMAEVLIFMCRMRREYLHISSSKQPVS